LHFKKPINLNSIKFDYVKKEYPNLNYSRTEYQSERTNYLKKKRIEITEIKSESMEKSKFGFSIDKDIKKVLIIGNSVSQDLFLMFDINNELFNNFEFRYFRMHLSNFLQRTDLEKKKSNLLINDNLFKNADMILISSNFRKYGRYSDDLNSIYKINDLVKKYNKKLILTSNAPYFDNNIYPALDLVYRYGHHKKNLKDKFDNELFLLINKKEFRKNISLEKISKELGVTFLRKTDYSCNFLELKCKTFDKNNHPLLFDGFHVTLNGAKYFGRVIYEINWLNLLN
jgi:hypothetical protein